MTYIFEKNRIFAAGSEGKTLAEVRFSPLTDGVVSIDHTFVDDSIRGKGTASGMLTLLAEKLRGENKKAYPACSYALDWFEKHPDYADVRAEKS